MGFWKGKKLKWDCGKESCWNIFGEMDDGRMGKRVGINMASEDSMNHSQQRKINRIETFCQ